MSDVIPLQRPDAVLSLAESIAAHPAGGRRMSDDTAVKLAVGRVRRGDVPGALQILTRQAVNPCRYCDLPLDSWPTEDCDEPRLHTGTQECACGDSLTFAESVDERWRHRRCRIVSVST